MSIDKFEKEQTTKSGERKFRNTDKEPVLHRNSFLKNQEFPKRIIQKQSKAITILTLQ